MINQTYTLLLEREIQQETAEIMSNCQTYPISFEGYKRYLETGERLFLEREYYIRRKATHTLALSYYLKKDPEVLARLEECLWLICNEFSWALPAHLPIENNHFTEESKTFLDLNAAETGQMLAEVYEWFQADLSTEIKERLLNEVDKRLFTAYEKEEWWWEDQTNNWSSVIASCIGMAAISLLQEQPIRQAQLFKKLDRSFTAFLSGYHDDGACDEGVGYWSYGFGYYCYFAEKYLVAFNEAPYLEGNKIREIAKFPQKASLSNGQFVPFSDDNNGEIPSGLLSFVNRYFKVAVPPSEAVSSLDFFHTYRWLDLSRNLLWSSPLKNYDQTESVTYFADLEWLLVKDPQQGLSFATKGGSNNEAHNHNDVGSFIIGDNETLYLTDLGAGEYTKAYFDPNKRYESLLTSSRSHSVPIINQQEQRPGSYSAKTVNLTASQTEVTFSLELAELYPEESQVATFQRCLSLNINERMLTVNDQINFKKVQENQVEQHFISKIQPIHSQGTICWKGQQGGLELRVPEGHHVAIETETYRNHHGQAEQVFIASICRKVVENVYEQAFVFKLN